MKRIARIFIGLILFAAVVGPALWWWNRPAPPPPFAVRQRALEVKVPPSLSVGQYFAAMVAPDGSLWVWGDPGRSGMDFGIRRGWTPEPMGEEKDWKQVAAGYFGLLALKQNGTLWAIGSNTEGLLGSTNIALRLSELTRVGTDNDWSEIQAGVAHCMARKRDGSLWAWGQNRVGQVGAGKASPFEPPTRMGLETNWAAISPGAFNSFALRNDGTIWMWGQGFNTAISHPSPVQLGAETNWTAISAGEYHLAGLRADGTSWLIGANASIINRDAPRPGTNWFLLNDQADWVEVRSGENCLFAKRSDGSWYPAGQREDFGSVGPWRIPEGFDPLLLHPQRGTTLMLMRDGRLWSLGKRIGAKPAIRFLEQVKYHIDGFLGRPRSVSYSEHSDQRPFLLWEHP